jgi:three-Cys-motif partner protein
VDQHLFDPAEYGDDLEQAGRELKIPRARDVITEAREFGGWTIEKLQVLRLYLKMYRQVAGGGSYIDGFAGEGLVRVKDKSEQSEGSALIALRSTAFKQLFLYERPRVAAKLRNHLADNCTAREIERCRIRGGDFNELVREDMADDLIPREKPCFAFLDPNSTQLDWVTIEALSQYKSFVPNPDRPKHPHQCKVELWVLLNTHQALLRLRERTRRPGYETSPSALTMDRVMGGREAWQAYLEEAHRGPAYLAWLFERNLCERLGYRAARSLLILDPKSHRPQYYMVHASDHPAAFSFMRFAHRAGVPGTLDIPLPLD